ncbi:MAG: lipocalin family protein [Spirochaetales bacterium]|nr:lipocalin family protein [Spirochaetales bacterium]
MNKKLRAVMLMLAALIMISVTGCSLSSQITNAAWESVNTYTIGSAAVNYRITFESDTNYKVEMYQTFSSSDTVYSTAKGTYTIDGDEITFQCSETTIDYTSTYVTEALIGAGWYGYDLFPYEEGDSVTLTCKKDKYRILLLSYDALYFTDSSGSQYIFTEVDD